jgi:hypothetical protein
VCPWVSLAVLSFYCAGPSPGPWRVWNAASRSSARSWDRLVADPTWPEKPFDGLYGEPCFVQTLQPAAMKSLPGRK